MADAAARFPATAKWIAAARARESERPDRLFNDPFASALAGDEGFAILARSEAASGGENSYLPVRARYFDDLLLSASARQVVLLGAGCDTRAYRLRFPDGACIFELDRAEVFEDKERILTAANAKPRCVRRAVAVDFSGSWIDDLTAAGFDSSKPSTWLAEGLLFYLRPEHVRSLLEGAGQLSAATSLFAADVFGTGLLDQASMQPYLRWLESTSRPSPFCTDDPGGLFAACGWSSAKVVEPGQPEASFGRLPPRSQGQGTNRTYLITARKNEPQPIAS
jgi:methyltransferase (TIGR00027 family)